MDIPNVPVHCNRLWPSREEALSAPRGDMELTFCNDCTHVFNASFDPKLVEYSPGYENSLHFSPRFQEYAQALAGRLVKDYDLFGKKVIEIGCGRGEFLAMLCDLGQNQGVGFDPSASPGPQSDFGYGNVSIVKDYYSERYSDEDPDLVCCRHVLEHVQNPVEFLGSITRTLGQSSEAVLFFEVPNVMFTLKDLGIWDLIYEHCSYFTLQSLQTLFRSVSCEVLRSESTFMDQFLCLEAACQDRRESGISKPHLDASAVSSYVAGFADNYRETLAQWRSFFDRELPAGAKVAVWGAGSKGVTFLNALNLTDQVQCVVDINPAKQGLYVPGTGQQVVSPPEMEDDPPEAIVIMNPVYQSEIKTMVAELGLTPTFHVV